MGAEGACGGHQVLLLGCSQTTGLSAQGRPTLGHDLFLTRLDLSAFPIISPHQSVILKPMVYLFQFTDKAHYLQ